ncbi:MAG: hypothetical protein QOE77_2798 [Blastocatellia bacterium]|jgi:hypothetical protein|nr:hypothetical protein [Blastocatellia bacterium]
MKLLKQFFALALISFFLTSMPIAQTRKPRRLPPNAEQVPPGSVVALRAKIARFAPTVLTANTANLSANDRRALAKIIAAAKYLDPLFRRQVWSGNEALMQKLEHYKDPAWVHYFRINSGPWSRLDHNEPFVADVPQEKPPGANYYPEDMTKDEFNAWVAALPEKEKEKATGFFYVIRRDANGKLKTVGYSDEYRDFLEPAAKLLREAAALTSNKTLKNFLKLRADAFASDNYYASDVAWMELDAPIEVTIGPYETYEDELFGYKAAFEAYVTLRDQAESAKLKKFSQYLQELENNLPMDPQYRNPQLGAASPITVVNEVFSSGEGNSGVQTAAYNLPNDERVVKAKGTKKVMLKNVQEAKFQKTLIPISKVVLARSQQSALDFETFFTHILTHELMHGIGPHNVTINGQPTTVRKQLKELYSPIEEAKADITGLWALQYLIDKGVVPKSMERTLYVTYLASAFRSVRFGVNEAHGRGMALQFNYLVDEGAIRYNERNRTFSVDEARIKEAVRKLTHDLLTVEAEGSYDGAKAMLDKYGILRAPMKSALDRLDKVPTDIEPIFPLAK